MTVAWVETPPRKSRRIWKPRHTAVPSVRKPVGPHGPALAAPLEI